MINFAKLIFTFFITREHLIIFLIIQNHLPALFGKSFKFFSSSLILINIATKSFRIHLQVPHENTVQEPPMAPTISGAIPNSLGLRLETEQRHFKGDGKLVKIKCIAEVGSRKYETERKVHMAYVNNQRLSAGDMHAAAHSIRPSLLARLLTSILALVLLTTWPTGFLLAWVGLHERKSRYSARAIASGTRDGFSVSCPILTYIKIRLSY